MLRRILVAILGVALRVFYRRIEVIDAGKVPPEERPALFVLNHPNGLVDPLFILCTAPRRVSFLAKSTIFKMPVLGWIARGLEALPVYRQQDQGEDPARNAETFAKARALLARGVSIAIFPEGTTHSEPSLKPIKSGAARIALGAAAELDGLAIVPAGLYYTAKETFRSKALVRFGDPIPVERVALGEDGAPPREAVRALSARIDAALRAVTLNADHKEALDLVARAERILASEPDGPRTVADELDTRRRLEEGYTFFRERAPHLLDHVIARIGRYEAELEAAGDLDPATLRASYAPGPVLRFAAGRLVRLVVALPVALAGVVVHYPTYRLCGVLATRLTDEDVIVATVKLLAALLLFPLTWAALAGLAAWRLGWAAGAAALLLGPLSAWFAVRWTELLASTLAVARGFWFYLARRRFLEMLVRERAAIRNDLARLGEALERHRAAPERSQPSAASGTIGPS